MKKETCDDKNDNKKEAYFSHPWDSFHGWTLLLLYICIQPSFHDKKAST